MLVQVGVSGDNLTFSESTMIVFRTHGARLDSSICLRMLLKRLLTLVLTSLYGSKSDLKASLDLLAKVYRDFLSLVPGSVTDLLIITACGGSCDLHRTARERQRGP